MCNICISYGALNIVHAMDLETETEVLGISVAGYIGMFFVLLSPSCCIAM